MLNIIIAGLGGQGTILVSRLIGEAAVTAGFDVRGSETIGMAQRGGSVISHLRIHKPSPGSASGAGRASGAGSEIYSPLIPPFNADMVIAFEAGEAIRAADFLKPGGSLVVCNRIIKPVTGGESYTKEPLFAWLSANVKQLFAADGEELSAQCGERFLNTALAGFAMQTRLFPFSADDMEAVIRKKIKPQFVEQNIHALQTGYTHKPPPGVLL
ncbi:pyruvate:ferredoxin (flavodoxin) oxidoreductase [Spirochaetia bacterium]|nr:pyruvate:ferredoxin (flavodoxin) oxidoreductase [Spirochaetia bacterium]